MCHVDKQYFCQNNPESDLNSLKKKYCYATLFWGGWIPNCGAYKSQKFKELTFFLKLCHCRPIFGIRSVTRIDQHDLS